MKTVNVKVHNAKETIQSVKIITNDGKPNVIKAGKGVNYEFLEEGLGRAPQHVITKRVNNDLHLSFDKDGQESDLIIEGFYSKADQALIGMAEDGSYYYYIPDTAEVSDYVTQLEPGDIEGQALGGPAQSTPWWAGQSDDGFAILPWLIGLGGLGLVGAALGKNDDNDEPSPPVISKPSLTAEDDGSVTVTPTSEATETDVTYTDEEGNKKSPTFTKDPDTGKWADNDPNDNVTVDPETGVITIPADEVKDGSEVKATQTTPKGKSTPATVIAKDDIPKLIIDDVTEDNIINAAEAGETIVITGTVTDNYEADDKVTLTVNGKEFTGVVNVDGEFAISVLGSDLAADPDMTVDGAFTTLSSDDTTTLTVTTTQNYSVDTTAPTAPVIGFESTGADDVYNSEEVGEDSTITATVTVPEGTKVGDTLTVNGEVAPVTQAIIDDGVAIEIAP
ncbi:Ig-like domain-containing protein, partial [Psychrobacter pygoscelis]|uniref:Ig-like domain-containing protein n=1 Tax=Psychrobacter pygoscelis TaxID=2488563 RepID=UPI00103CB053